MDRDAYGRNRHWQNFDVAPDGKRLTVLMPSDTADDRQEQNQVIFLQNFSDEIRRRVNAR
jgi:hypothetical protein